MSSWGARRPRLIATPRLIFLVVFWADSTILGFLCEPTAAYLEISSLWVPKSYGLHHYSVRTVRTTFLVMSVVSTVLPSQAEQGDTGEIIIGTRSSQLPAPTSLGVDYVRPRGTTVPCIYRNCSATVPGLFFPVFKKSLAWILVQGHFFPLPYTSFLSDISFLLCHSSGILSSILLMGGCLFSGLCSSVISPDFHITLSSLEYSVPLTRIDTSCLLSLIPSLFIPNACSCICSSLWLERAAQSS